MTKVIKKRKPLSKRKEVFVPEVGTEPINLTNFKIVVV